MRPVNLLPGEYRAARASGQRAGSAYVALGTLAALLAMVLLYVVTANQISSREDAAAEAQGETAALHAEIAALGAFGDFSQIKQTRMASVTSLAQGRFDWERFVRELALVLPEDTWLGEVTAATAPEDSDSAVGSGPYAQLQGCAVRQPDVATLLVRLRKMHRVEDVTLAESVREGDVPVAPSTSLPTGGLTPAVPVDTDGCGSFYAFDVKVAFEVAPTVADQRRIPASLGGGL